tara:strand:+ start:2403 stop:3368 length:966 start_codon:yes stop_codon:yes gene_type:complete
MAHEITSTDGLVLHKEEAWHGLGTIVEDAPTPQEALQIAGLDWTVKQTEGVGDGNVHSDGWTLNYRSDNNDVLGCVTSGYQPIQNETVARFCEELSMDTVVKVESAGSLFSGKRLWFLLKADTFDVGNDDPVVPYVLIANGHDGSLSFSARPTSVRVVCNNTLSWALGKKGQVFNLRHTQNIMTRVDEARTQLRKYLGGLEDFQEVCEHLRNTEVTREEVENFFYDMYNKCVETIPTEIKTDADYDKKQRASRSIWEICNNFDSEREVAGTTYWNAFNASSRWLQNRNRTKDSDMRAYNKLMGASNDKTSTAFKLAMQHAD